MLRKSFKLRILIPQRPLYQARCISMTDKKKAEQVYHKDINEEKVKMDNREYIDKVAHEKSVSNTEKGKVEIDTTMRERVEQDDRVQKHLKDHGETNTYSKTSK